MTLVADTNVVVRLVMRDDEEQWRAALGAFEKEPVMLMISVVMETEWVLRKVYNLPRAHIAEGLEKICGARSVLLESDVVIGEALDDYKAGFDLADALHVRRAQALGASKFVTFDKRLRRQSARRNLKISVCGP